MKTLPLKKAIELVEGKRAVHKIGFTNGCFDILHKGHVDYLNLCKEECDFLILGLNSDASIQKIKGPNRPIIDQAGRSAVISALRSIDLVVIFDEDTPLKLIESLRPDVLMKGADYTVDRVIGAKEVIAKGGQVKLIPFTDGYSTTSIINKIKNLG